MSETQFCVFDMVPCECSPRQAERCQREVERGARIAADYARRGDPQRFTLHGHTITHHDDGPSLTTERIDPPLEEGEVIEVVEASKVMPVGEHEMTLTAVRDLGRALEWALYWIRRNELVPVDLDLADELERWHEARRALKRWGPESKHAAERRKQ